VIPGGLGGFLGRSAGTKKRLLQEGGGNEISEARVAAGLKWISEHQDSRLGSWSLHEFNKHARELVKVEGSKEQKWVAKACNCQTGSNRHDDTAATAFALLPYLAAGITHKSANPDPEKPATRDYTKVVKGGLDYLKSVQGQNGNFGGTMYSHAIATIAYCEAFGLTGDTSLKLVAQKAINYIEFAQDPNGGGWRYSPKSPGDTSVARAYRGVVVC